MDKGFLSRTVLDVLRPATDWIVDITTTRSRAKNVEFGLPVKPTNFVLAFSDHECDDPIIHDTDCVVISDSQTNVGSPVALADSISELVIGRSSLQSEKNSLKRSEFRRHVRKAIQEPSKYG